MLVGLTVNCLPTDSFYNCQSVCVCAPHRDIVVGCCDIGALQVSFSCKLHRDEVDFKFVLVNFDVELVFAL